MGPKYALLRQEFSKWRDKSLERRKYITEPNNILVSFGGVDPQNITTEVINKLCKIPCLEGATVNVVLGSQSPYIDAVEIAANKSISN